MPPARDNQYQYFGICPFIYSAFYTYLHTFSAFIELEQYCFSGLLFSRINCEYFPMLLVFLKNILFIYF